MNIHERDAVIAGGGPAGMMVGYLLARAGLKVTVLEKHADFLRDFRGDTIHPSTITLLGELGLREKFLALPVTRVRTLDVVIDGERMSLVDFGTLPPPDNFLVFAPQWDFLNFLAREGAAFPGFEVRMNTEAVDLLRDGTTVTGVRAQGLDGEIELRANLTIAADGRTSRMREAAGFDPERLGVPIDVLWFGLPRPVDPPPPTLAYLDERGIVLTLERGDHYQGGFVIPKGGYEELRAAALEAFRDRLVSTAPVLASVVGSITDWDQVKTLSVQIDRLTRWHLDGFICIGDAAHAMSPVGGVGVNYAIQDAVALANVVTAPLRLGRVPERILDAVQRRRMPPVRRMQSIQRLAHDRIRRPLGARPGPAIPRVARLVLRALQPLVRRVTARVLGRGFLPEHVRPGGLVE
ncbi:MAG: FAD-dependent oxidoreductase [Pseudolysinimonas sp.]